MRLSSFITTHIEAILVEWEAFASTRTPAATRMTPLALRDHAKEILEAIALDISTPQTAFEQGEKSKGNVFPLSPVAETAAQTHAVLRAQSGFDINQLAAEYRAMRASVLRLWAEVSSPQKEDLQDVIRFNEAIDQALSESIDHFSMQVTQSRNLLLGVLAHDMRTPLNAVFMTASLLESLHAGEEVSEAASCLIRCGASLKALLDDLTDFNRTKLGLGINVDISESDLEVICDDEVKQQCAANPSREIRLTMTGDCKGIWDPARLQQVLRNLISNALKYGSKNAPVLVHVSAQDGLVHLEVRNEGQPIDPSTFDQIFDPLKRGAERNEIAAERGLGLGLFIVREIVRAHGGTIEVRSSEQETVFDICLPRTADPKTDLIA